MHVTEALRDAPLRHDDGDLVQRLGQQRPEIPVVVRAAQTRARVALDGMVEVREPQRITEEEHRRVVAHDVPVALLGVELDREAADIAFRVGGAALAGDGREAREQRGLLADLAEDFCACVARDVVRHLEGAVGTPALGVHAPLRDNFPVEMRHLLDQPDVLQQRRAARTGRHDVGVVGDRRTGGIGEFGGGHVGLRICDKRGGLRGRPSRPGPRMVLASASQAARKARGPVSLSRPSRESRCRNCRA
jgi:hypothetical protein